MATEQEKVQEYLFQRERGTGGRRERKEGGDSGAVGAVGRERLKKIFRHFDADGDGRLDRAEMVALIRAANPRIGFTGEQTDAIVDAVFRTYCYLLGRDDQHITVGGLLRTFGDGTADVDRDFDTRGLSLDDDSRAPPDATASSTASCVSPTSLSLPPPLGQRLVAGELDGQNGDGAVSPGADGDGASPRHSVTGEPPASSPPSPSFCSKARDSELDCRDHLPSSSELEENADGPSPCPSVAWERRPSLASSSFCSEAEDSDVDYTSDHLLQSEIEERPSFRWLSPSFLLRPPPSNRPESSEVDWERLISPDLQKYSGERFDDASPEDIKWTVFGRDESSGKICCLVLARGMDFRWQDGRGGCWRYDHAVAVLSEVCWLQIDAQVSAADLSAGTAYVGLLVYKLSRGAFGLGCGGETQKASIYVGPRRVSHRTVRLQPSSDLFRRGGAEEPRRRKDGWMEIGLGEFSVGNESRRGLDRTVVGMGLNELDRPTQRKGGLLVRGVELRPKAYRVTR